MTGLFFGNIYPSLHYLRFLVFEASENLEEEPLLEHKISNPTDRPLRNQTNWINLTAR